MRLLAKRLTKRYPGIEILEFKGVEREYVVLYNDCLCNCRQPSCYCNKYSTRASVLNDRYAEVSDNERVREYQSV